ncbi:interferon-induced transmembrane protein [Elysia marginata]|uniref:Interferon-induced transmembrane protein n=1 Tax=Elysia marginata TaxID=1093978 RepID=A0AAV4I1D4_9GAST|nr:interferon-induced transmembrane protein [Elysia marginata]
MVMSIVSIFFFLPLGIIAVIKSCEARRFNARGDPGSALIAAKTARKFAIAAIIIGIILLVFYIIIKIIISVLISSVKTLIISELWEYLGYVIT